MNTNSYLMLIALTIGIFVLWVLVMTYRLLIKKRNPDLPEANRSDGDKKRYYNR